MTHYLAFALRFLGLLLFQQLVLNHFPIGGNALCFVFLLPFAFYTLPFDVPRSQLVLLGFICGLVTDAFESSYGLFTITFSALCYFIGIVRYRFYSKDEVENKQSGVLDHNALKNLPFIMVCNFVLLLVFYLIENFSWQGTGYAILRAFLSALLSTAFMLCIQFIFPSKRLKSR